MDLVRILSSLGFGASNFRFLVRDSGLRWGWFSRHSLGFGGSGICRNLKVWRDTELQVRGFPVFGSSDAGGSPS